MNKTLNDKNLAITLVTKQLHLTLNQQHNILSKSDYQVIISIIYIVFLDKYFC